MPQGRVSSSLTAFYKYAFVPLWVLVYGFPTVRILIGGVGALGEQSSKGWLVWALWTLFTAWFVYFAVRIHFVYVYIDSLRAVSLGRGILIHSHELLRADQLPWLSPPVIRVVYRRSTGAERTFWFLPKFRRSTFGVEIADENLLPDLNALAQRSGTPAA